MEYINHVTQFNGVCASKCAVASLVVRYDLDNVAQVVFHPLSVIGLLAMLREIERVSDVVLNLLRHGFKVFLRPANPSDGLLMLLFHLLWQFCHNGGERSSAGFEPALTGS